MTKLPLFEFADFEDVDLFGDLFDDLVEGFFVFVDGYGHASDVLSVLWVRR